MIIPTPSDPFSRIPSPDTAAYAGTELETERERAERTGDAAKETDR